MIDELIAELNNCLARVTGDYCFDVVTPGKIEAGQYVYLDGRFQRVTATKWEQGSGPTPTKCWFACEGNEQILELNPRQFYPVLICFLERCEPAIPSRDAYDPFTGTKAFPPRDAYDPFTERNCWKGANDGIAPQENPNQGT